MNRRLLGGGLLWLALIAIATIWVAQRGLHFRSNLLDLLPDTEATHALKDLAAQKGPLLIFGVRAQDEESALRAADSLTLAIRKNADWLQSAKSGDTATNPAGALGKTWWEHRLVLPSRDLETLAQRQDTAALLIHLRERLYAPILPSGNLKQDPWFQFPDWLMSLQAHSGGVGTCGPYPCVQREDGFWILVKARLLGNPFDAPLQEKTKAFLSQSDSLAQRLGVKIIAQGLTLYAEAGRSRTESELNLITLGSLAGVTVLLLAVFGSAAELLLGLSAIGLGLFGAAVLTHALFGGLQLITLVVGSTLIGVSVDYAILFFFLRRAGSLLAPGEAAKHARSQGWALGTTVLSYAALASSPFPALKEMAFFCVTGLITAFLCIWGFFPLILSLQKTGRPPASWFSRLADKLWQISRRPWAVIVVGVLVLGLWAGLPQMQSRDSLKSWQPPEPALLAGDSLLRQAFSAPSASAFYLVSGPTLEIALQREEALTRLLDSATAASAQPKAEGKNWIGLSAFLPSRQRQENFRENLLRLSVVPEIAERLVQLGYDPDGLDTLRRHLQVTSPLDPSPVWQSTQADFLRDMLTVDSLPTGWRLQVMLRDVKNHPLPGADIAGVTWVNQQGDLDDLVGHLRRHAQVLSLLAYVLIAALMCKRYGWKRGLRLGLAVGLVATMILGAAGWSSEGLQFFGLMGLVLALGMGVDYLIYLSDTAPERAAQTWGAILLTATTTLISYGLLIFSTTPALRQFAVLLSSGILFFLLTAPWVTHGLSQREQPK